MIRYFIFNFCDLCIVNSFFLPIHQYQLFISNLYSLCIKTSFTNWLVSGIFFSISVILVLKSIFLTDPLVSSIFLSTLQSFSLNFFFSIILWFISKFSCAMNFTPNIINLCKLLIIHCFFDIINYITDSSYSNRLEQLLICDSLIYQYPLSAKSTFFANNDVSIPVAFLY